MKIKLLTLILVSLLTAGSLQAGLFPQSPDKPTAAAPIGVGQAAPDFTLEDEKSNRVTLSDEYMKQPVLLVFYRGYW